MSEHPIEGLMTTAMSSIENMIDANTIIGEPIETTNNIIIIPISKVSFGFAAGGSEFKGETVDEYQKKEDEEEIQYKLPFGGGSGAGVSINPVGFLVITQDNVKLMPVEHGSSVDKLIDYIPDVLDKTSQMLNNCSKNKKSEASKVVNHIKETVRKINNEDDNNISMDKPNNDKEEYEYEYDETEYMDD